MEDNEVVIWAELIQLCYRKCGVRPNFEKVALWNIHVFLHGYDKEIFNEFKGLPMFQQLEVYKLLRESSAFLPGFMEVYG